MKRKAPTTYAPLFTFLGTGPDSVVADGEIVVVNFAGLGGACAGIEDALHRPVTHAINIADIGMRMLIARALVTAQFAVQEAAD